MQQKTNWMRYLIIGISTLLFSWQLGCRKRVEYFLQADFIFINETEHAVNYSGLLQLEQFTSDTVIRVGTGGDKNEKIESCCQGFLEDFQGDYTQVYTVFNDSLCLFYNENEGPTNLVNYEKRRIKNNHFEFTYRFTEEQYNEAAPCN